MHKWSALGYFYPPLYLETPGGGSGGGDGRASVTNLPAVPEPSEGDLDVLAGDEGDEGGDEGEEGEGDEEGQEGEEGEERPPTRRKPAEERTPPEEGEEGDEFDIDEGEEEPEEGQEKPPKKKEGQEGEPDKVPSIKALKESYPDIFKKFPHVRTAIAEHQQFRNVFATVADATEAAEHQQNFLDVSEHLMSGDFGFLLGEMRKADPESIGRIAKNILPELMKMDKSLYLDVTDAPIKQFMKAAYDRAMASGNKNLMNSAKYLWQFMTGKFEEPALSETRDPRDEEFNKRVETFENKKRQDALQTAVGEANTLLTDLVAKAIDPNNALKDFTKKALVRTMLGEIDQALSQDDAHVQRMDRLWAAAKRSSYSRGHLSRIVSAYLERAKMVLPTLARKVREEHGTGTGSPRQTQRHERQGERQPQQSQNQPPPRPSGQGRPQHTGKSLRDTNPRNIDWRKTSDADILGGRARLKR